MTYRELPTGWDSLLEPRWKGRVAVPDPLKSDMAAAALTEAAKNSEKEEFLDFLVENMQYQMPETFKEVEQGISDCRYSIGVTSEEAAKALLAAAQDVDYIYPEERGCLFREAQSFSPQNQATVEKRRAFQGAVSAIENAVSETYVERTSDNCAACEQSYDGEIYLCTAGEASVFERAVLIAGTIFRCAAISLERVDGIQIGRGRFYASATQTRFGASVV